MIESQNFNNPKDSSTDLFVYEATPEQRERTKVFLGIVSKFESAQIRYAVTGSFGLDGLYGSQTRANGDIDILLADRAEMAKASALLAEQGIAHHETKSSGGDVFIHIPTNTEIGLKTIERVREYSDADVSLFIPESPNAQLRGVAFKTPTIEGHELYNAIQQQRADKFGWGEYRHREHRDRLIKRIKVGS